MPVAQTRLEILQTHKLLQCVRKKDKAQIEKLCTSGIPHLINYSEPENGETGLHLAARVNDEEMVKYILELGAHPNVVDLKGRTAAIRAAEFGHVQTLEILATAGADMTTTDIDGKGILFYCILPTSRHTKCAELVIENNADCNNIGNDGMPLLVLACFEAKENEKICQLLLDHAADPNSVHPSTGQTALAAAASSGCTNIVRNMLLKGADVNACDKNRLTAAHRAAMKGHFDVLRVLAGFGADLGCSDVILNTPLHYGAEGGFAECCRYLGQRGCKANVKNEDGLLPKAIAKNNGFKDVLKECKKAEKLSKKLQSGGKAPTEAWAVRLYDWTLENSEKLKERFETLDPDKNDVISRDDFYDILMTLDAPIDEEDFKNLFQLHDKTKEGVINYNDFMAAKKYVHKTYLISAYEKKDKKGKKGKKGKKKKGKTKIPMPICLGPEGDRTEFGGPPEYLIERHVPFTDTGRFDRDRPPEHPIQDDSAWYLHHQEVSYIKLNDAASMGDIDSLKQCFHYGRNVDTTDKYFKTALMVACAKGNTEVVEFLLASGADITIIDNFRWTPLHHACLSGQLDLVQLLLRYGADINAQSLNGATPLMRAIQTSSPEIVQYLIEKGCDCTLENRKGVILHWMWQSGGQTPEFFRLFRLNLKHFHHPAKTKRRKTKKVTRNRLRKEHSQCHQFLKEE
ncbi:Ankyrin repeat and EF-hand domain-containing protein 1 [Holothuria leucospilota]|uniref:Ankyrin repeat and EF-hand domain-containing protein 1 n=1 Tax=Holothuria leucospilota TaxID=206669 RepID=A0A9Q1CI90_HOLLE|nr:Ankyrin repeat and EF-hand domain-containing protein 1 [Holothuria leucospilota]